MNEHVVEIDHSGRVTESAQHNALHTPQIDGLIRQHRLADTNTFRGTRHFSTLHISPERRPVKHGLDRVPSIPIRSQSFGKLRKKLERPKWSSESFLLNVCLWFWLAEFPHRWKWNCLCPQAKQAAAFGVFERNLADFSVKDQPATNGNSYTRFRYDHSFA